MSVFLHTLIPAYAICLSSQIFSVNISVESNYETRKTTSGNILGDGWEDLALCEVRKETSYGLYGNILKSYFFPNARVSRPCNNSVAIYRVQTDYYVSLRWKQSVKLLI